MVEKFAPKGEMSERELISAASLLAPDSQWISQKRFYYDSLNKRRFYKVDCVSLATKIVIEYDGPKHYTDVWKNQRDNDRRSFFEQQGFTFFRWPYYCQLTKAVADYFFGEHEDEKYQQCISQIYGVKSEELILACGFHTTKNTPSNFTYLGVDRFISELSLLPLIVKAQVAESLRRYCRDEGSQNLVIGQDPRMHKLLEFQGSRTDLCAFYKRQF